VEHFALNPNCKSDVISYMLLSFMYIHLLHLFTVASFYFCPFTALAPYVCTCNNWHETKNKMIWRWKVTIKIH